MDVDICVCVYNEEKTIGRLLDALLKQKIKEIKIKNIYVVSSACTDNTNDIVKDFIKKDKRIKLIEQEKREGKASAINLFLKKAKSEILILESGDTIPVEEMVEELCLPFKNKEIGMTGGNPIPVNKKDNFLGYIIHSWWYLHNHLPRYGELIAFRNIIKEIDKTTAVDEAFIENLITAKGLKLKHCPKAIVYNKGADNLNDLLKQRRRVYVGHVLLKKYQKYKVESFNFKDILKHTINYWKLEPKLKHLIWLFLGSLVEVYGRFLGMYDLYILKKNPYIWDISKSTKNA